MKSDFFEELFNGLKSNGYVEVDKIHLPDGYYYKNGGGYQYNIDTFETVENNGLPKRISGFSDTQWSIVTPFGIRGFYNHEKLQIIDGKIVNDSSGYKVFTRDKEVIRDIKINKILNE